MKFSIKNLFTKCDQIRRTLKKFLMENLVFCAVMFSCRNCVFNKIFMLKQIKPIKMTLCVQGILLDH